MLVDSTMRLVLPTGSPLTSKVVTGVRESTRKVAVELALLPARSETSAVAVCVPWERSDIGTKAAEDDADF